MTFNDVIPVTHKTRDSTQSFKRAPLVVLNKPVNVQINYIYLLLAIYVSIICMLNVKWL